jgi:4-carboxymuconolactone decarboxylase
MSESTTRQDRHNHGRAVLDAVDGAAGAKVIDALKDISPELGHQVVAWGFGEIYSRPGLEPRDRQLVTLGMLTALGGCEPQLGGLEVGADPSLRPAGMGTARDDLRARVR